MHELTEVQQKIVVDHITAMHTQIQSLQQGQESILSALKVFAVSFEIAGKGKPNHNCELDPPDQTIKKEAPEDVHSSPYYFHDQFILPPVPQPFNNNNNNNNNHSAKKEEAFPQYGCPWARPATPLPDSDPARSTAMPPQQMIFFEKQ